VCHDPLGSGKFHVMRRREESWNTLAVVTVTLDFMFTKMCLESSPPLARSALLFGISYTGYSSCFLTGSFPFFVRVLHLEVVLPWFVGEPFCMHLAKDQSSTLRR